MLTASKDANVKSFTYASSSSIYGNNLELPKVENKTGDPLSPYAVTKHLNEKYAEVFAKNYGFKCIGLRYFNVFGKRQDPNGPYAAVIPKWTSAMINNKDLHINGDGMTSRDFSYVDNIVQMNILAALARDDHKDEIYNAAVGDITSLNELFYIIKESLIDNGINVTNEPIYRDFRPGDVLHSQADISKAQKDLNYFPKYKVKEGINRAMKWYIQNHIGKEI